MLTAVLTFSLAGALLVILPGPDTLIAIRSLIHGGRKLAVRTMAGSLTGLLIWSMLAVGGLAAVLRASHDAYLVLKVVGGVYLVWMGVQSFRRRANIELISKDESTKFFHGGYLAGLTTNLLNPKVGVFFVTFLPGFVPAHNSIPLTTLLFGAIYELETALYFGVLLILASGLVRWMSTGTVRKRLDRITGFVLVGFGVRLALES